MRAPEFDWDSYWTAQRTPKDVVRGGRRMAERMERFMAIHSIEPRAFADAGCGPAVMLFSLSRRFPACVFYGLDGSGAVTEMNRRRAAREGIANLRFRQARLPRTLPGPFDVVTCFATLHYVPDPIPTLRGLFRSVRRGGYLVFNYPNRVQRGAYARDARRDPDQRERFALVLAAENLLSQRTIQSSLGRRPVSFWSEVGEPPKPLNPCVAVRR